MIDVFNYIQEENGKKFGKLFEKEAVTCCEKKFRARFDLSKSVRIKLIPMVTVKKILLIA